MSERRPIVVVADDLGLRSDWDAAILAAHDFGFVHAVSLVANGPQYAAVLPALRQRPALEVGVHLNVYEGRPLSPAGEVTSLRMPASVSRFIADWAARRVSANEVATEWRRQIRRVAHDELRPAFLNSHYHLHMLPELLEVTIALAREFSIPFIRVTDEPPWLAGNTRAALRTAPLWALALRARQRLTQAGLRSPPAARGLVASAELGVSAWENILAEQGTSPIEIVCHPGQSDAQREALTSPVLLDALRRRGLPFSFRS